MATSTAEKRKSQARRARPATPRKAGERGKKAPKRTVKSAATKAPKRAVKSAAKPAAKGVVKPIAKRVAKRAAKVAARRAAATAQRLSAQMLELAAERARDAIRSAQESEANRRLPIQLSIDVAVPINVAWEHWLQSGSLPEGLHRIDEIERDGNDLVGQIAGLRGGEWRAEIVDEREAESFAWRSTEGSDCAGLVTFHQLSDRLTRIELDLDVIPTTPSEAVMLALHFADRRAEADLRRFKAGAEFINPDVYAQ